MSKLVNMPSSAAARKRLLWVGAFVGVWTCLALLSTVESYIGQLKFDKPIPWSLALRRSFKDWYAVGVLSIPVIWFCRINRFETRRRSRWILAHFGGTALFFIAYVLLSSWLLAGEISVQTGEVLRFSSLVKKFAVHDSVMSLMLYWFMVCGYLGWHYYQQYRERDLRTAQLQRELGEARLEALRMQLNPHFLFNTLHTVSALIHFNPEGADRVVARLSELLRLSLDKSKPQEVPLSEELSFLEHYLEIVQVRFADKVRIEKDVQAETKNALVPYLVLQPLVENAIRHGIEQREEPGRISISARRNDGRLVLTVSDNGPGINNQQETGCGGIGLSNTRSRLNHLYGVRFRLELNNSPGGGLEARVEIPFRTEEVPNSDSDGQPK